MKKPSKGFLILALVFVLLLTACTKQELPKETVSSEVTTPPAENPKIETEEPANTYDIEKYDDMVVELFALKEDNNGNYCDMFLRINYADKIIEIPDRKQFELSKPLIGILDINGDGNGELFLKFLEKNEQNELVENVYFMDINTEKELSLSDLGLEDTAEVTHGTAEFIVNDKTVTYDFNELHFKGKENLNKILKKKDIQKAPMLYTDNLTLMILSEPMPSTGRNQRVTILKYDDKFAFYRYQNMPMPFPKYNNGKEEITYESSVQMGLIDLDNDGIKEIVITMWVGKGTGYSATDLHIIDSTTMEEIVTLTNDDIAILISSYIDAKIVTKEEQVIINICVNNDPDNTYTHTVKRNENITYFETPSFTQSVGFTIDETNNKVMIDAGMMIAAPWYAGSFSADITVVDGKVHFANINNIFFE